MKDPVELRKKAWELYCAANKDALHREYFWDDLPEFQQDYWLLKAAGVVPDLDDVGDALPRKSVDGLRYKIEETYGENPEFNTYTLPWPAPVQSKEQLLVGASPVIQQILDLLGIKDKNIYCFKFTVRAGDSAIIEVERWPTEEEALRIFGTIIEQYELKKKGA